MAINNQLSNLRPLIEAACTQQSLGTTAAVSEAGDEAYRWLSPRIPVGGVPSDLDPMFEVDFQVVRTPMLQEAWDYLVISLYLVGGDPAVLPREPGRLGRRLLEVDALNREEPGVKFRFQAPVQAEDGAWIVVETDVKLDVATPKGVADALTRLLDCAEARYLDVYEWCVQPD